MVSSYFLISFFSFAIGYPIGRHLDRSNKVNIVILGGPGSGKGTQAETLQKHYHICHISTGQLIRAEIAKNETELSMQLNETLSKGGLVADEVVASMVSSKLDSDECKNGSIFDGYPRNIAQAEMLQDLLIKKTLKLTAVIELDVDEANLIKRITGRLIHAESGRTYHLDFKPPKQFMVDDVSGEPLNRRDDDKLDVVKSRLEIYKLQMTSIDKFYSDKQLLQRVPANGNPTEVFDNIKLVVDGFITE